jgi:hypothetical protein
MSYNFFALHFTFFTSFFTSRSSDVEAETSCEELSINVMVEWVSRILLFWSCLLFEGSIVGPTDHHILWYNFGWFTWSV